MAERGRIPRGAYAPDAPRSAFDRLGVTMWGRHANPWSGWTRVGLGALLPLAVWSRDWTAIGLVVVAIATNPFWFSPPRRRDGFMYHGVRGERLWIRDGLAKTQRTQSAAAGLAALVGLWLCWERVALGPVLYLASVVWKLVYIRRMAGYSRARPSAPFP